MSCKFLFGEADGVNTVFVEEWMEKTLPSLVYSYSKKDNFKASKTRLFFNLFPGKTYTMKGEKYHGGKLSKVLLTVWLYINADGTKKLTLFVIDKTKKLRYFKRTLKACRQITMPTRKLG